MERTIYSKRFPQLDLQTLREELEKDTGGEDAAAPSFREFVQEIQKNIVCIPRRDKIKNRRRLIHLAKKLSREFEIGMDIEEQDHFISIYLHMYFALYSKSAKQMLCRLMDMCNGVSFSKFKTESCDFTITLEYNTYDVYLNGHKVN